MKKNHATTYVHVESSTEGTKPDKIDIIEAQKRGEGFHDLFIYLFISYTYKLVVFRYFVPIKSILLFTCFNLVSFIFCSFLGKAIVQSLDCNFF